MDTYKAICNISPVNNTFANRSYGSRSYQSLSNILRGANRNLSFSAYKYYLVNMFQDILKGADRIVSFTANSLFNFNISITYLINATYNSVRKVIFDNSITHLINAIYFIRKEFRKSELFKVLLL